MQNLDADGVLSKVIAGLPKVAELIAAIPEARRSQALEAVEQSYFKSARELGYDESDARQWAAAVMSQMRIE